MRTTWTCFLISIMFLCWVTTPLLVTSAVYLRIQIIHSTLSSSRKCLISETLPRLCLHRPNILKHVYHLEILLKLQSAQAIIWSLMTQTWWVKMTLLTLRCWKKRKLQGWLLLLRCTKTKWKSKLVLIFSTIMKARLTTWKKSIIICRYWWKNMQKSVRGKRGDRMR